MALILLVKKTACVLSTCLLLLFDSKGVTTSNIDRLKFCLKVEFTGNNLLEIFFQVLKTKL